MLPRASSVCFGVRVSARACRARRATVVTSLVPPDPPVLSLVPHHTRQVPRSPCDVANRPRLLWRELPRAAAAQCAQGYGAKANANETIDFEIECRAEAP